MLDPRGLIKKANLTFTFKFFWFLVRHRLSLMAPNNILTLDRAVLVATFMVGLEIDFAKLFISVIHVRSFNTSTTYPFSCIILDLYRYARVPIWHRDTLRTPFGTVDIGTSGIRPMWWHHGEGLPLSENLANTIEFSQRDES